VGRGDLLENTLNSHERLWSNYDRWALERGRLAARLLAEWLPLPGSRILDAGCGSGGASRALAEAGARVTAVDLFPTPPHGLAEMDAQIQYVRADISAWSCDCPNDGVILWDVLEHVPDPASALVNIRTALKPGGLALIATPNRWSPFNALCDPHYGLPGVSLFNRKAVRRIVSGWLGWHRPDKADFPQLLSLGALENLLRKAGFSWRFINHSLFAAAMDNPAGLWNSPWHLRLFTAIRAHGWENILDKALNDGAGLRNRLLMPTFFILARVET